jgi:hypothetical protein
MPSGVDVDGHLSLVQRRRWRQVKILSRYQDDLPQASTSLPPPSESYTIGPEEADGGPSSTASSSLPTSNNPSVDEESGHPILRSPCNAFGLSRCYYSTKFPSHDPEDFNDFDALSDVSDPPPSHKVDLGPYLNHSSFALGEWYWSDVVQKTKKKLQKPHRHHH